MKALQKYHLFVWLFKADASILLTLQGSWISCKCESVVSGTERVVRTNQHHVRKEMCMLTASKLLRPQLCSLSPLSNYFI